MRKWGFWRDLPAVPIDVNEDDLAEPAGDVSGRTDFLPGLVGLRPSFEAGATRCSWARAHGVHRSVDESCVVA